MYYGTGDLSYGIGDYDPFNMKYTPPQSSVPPMTAYSLPTQIAPEPYVAPAPEPFTAPAYSPEPYAAPRSPEMQSYSSQIEAAVPALPSYASTHTPPSYPAPTFDNFGSAEPTMAQQATSTFWEPRYSNYGSSVSSPAIVPSNVPPMPSLPTQASPAAQTSSAPPAMGTLPTPQAAANRNTANQGRWSQYFQSRGQPRPPRRPPPPRRGMFGGSRGIRRIGSFRGFRR